MSLEGKGGREGGREGGRDGGREGGRERGRKGGEGGENDCYTYSNIIQWDHSI